jgi:hypothetical protein
LASQIGRDLTPLEVTVARVSNQDTGARDEIFGVKEGDALPIALPYQSPSDAPCHQLAPITIKRRESLQCLERHRCIDLRVRLEYAPAIIEYVSHSFLAPQTLRDPGPSWRFENFSEM